MKQTIVSLACALIASMAFAQTSTTTTEKTTTATAPVTTTETTTTYSAGTVTTYTPEKTIVVKTESEGPISFALSAPVRIVNAAGEVVKALTPGKKVRVFYTGTGEKRVVERVVVED